MNHFPAVDDAAPLCARYPSTFHNADISIDVAGWLRSSAEEKERTLVRNRDAVSAAKFVCRQCPMFVTCQEWVVGQDVWGVVAGTVPSERDGQPDFFVWCEKRNVPPSVYSYVEMRAKFQHVSLLEIAQELGMSGKAVRWYDVVNGVVPVSVSRVSGVMVGKLLRAGVPQRIVADRAQLTVHQVRKFAERNDWTRKRRVEDTVHVQHQKRWARLSHPARLVYDYLASVGNVGASREDVMRDVVPKISVVDRERAAQRSRKYTSREAELCAGGRRIVGQVLRFGVRSGSVRILVSPDGDVSYVFDSQLRDMWKKYRYRRESSHPQGQYPLSPSGGGTRR